MKVEEYIPLNDLKTPVLFLVFNRLDTTIQVFGEIKKAKPPKLYIASDGARETVKGEFEKVKAIRSYLSSNIDWECEVKTLYRDKNLGCKYAVSSAIDWFFQNEEMGIILEDDCLPSQSFFWYCEELLYKYKDDLRIWHISGNNFNKKALNNYSYSFTRNIHIWGWATWKSRWLNYDVEILNFKYFEENKAIKNIFNSKKNQKHWFLIFKNVYNGLIDTWDYQWVFTSMVNSGISIFPKYNLVTNIGFGPEATHTKNIKSKDSKIPFYELNFPLTHPKFLIRDKREEKKLGFKNNVIKTIFYKLTNFYNS